MLNVALIGAGFIGRVHARCVAASETARLEAVFDVDSVAAATLAAEYGARAAGSLAQVLDDPRSEAVIIAAPSSTHGELARNCARAGKPFLCEKPLDTDLDAARRTVREVEQAGLFAAIGFNRRFDEQHALLRRCVAQGEVGRVEMLHLTSRSQSPPTVAYVAASGGQLRDKGSHFFDLACWIGGERPEQIYALGGCLIEPRFAEYGDVDTAMIILRMPSGALCHLNFSRRTAYGYDERIEVFGAEGRLESRHPVPVDVALYRGDTIRQQGLHRHWFERMERTYATQLKAFVAALTGGEASTPGLRDGLVAEIIAERGVQSLRSGRAQRIDYDFD